MKAFAVGTPFARQKNLCSIFFTFAIATLTQERQYDAPPPPNMLPYRRLQLLCVVSNTSFSQVFYQNQQKVATIQDTLPTFRHKK